MVGVSLGLVGISMAVFQALVIRRFITRFGERKTAYIGMISGITSYLIVAFVPICDGIILVLLLVNGFSGMVMPRAERNDVAACARIATGRIAGADRIAVLPSA
jgi:DHA1 family tetracycline resistance protein-like MFS transporter